MIRRGLLPGLLLAAALCLGGGAAVAQEFSIDLGGDGALSSRTIQLFLLITVLSLAPGIAIMVTCFPFIITVLSILRQAIGLQQAPPNMLITSLAMFLTFYVMEPVFLQAWSTGISPYLDGEIDEALAMQNTLEPFRTFMAQRVDADTFAALAELRQVEGERVPTPASPLSVMVPSFLLSEMARAFQVGFLIFMPFLIIDLVVAAVLMSMGMMMVPPAIVSLPFKLSFFVVADGWALITTSLVRGYL